MILCGLWTYFKLNFFHLDKTVKKGYNIYIISFQEKVLAPALVCSRAFFVVLVAAQFGPSARPGAERLHVRIMPTPNKPPLDQHNTKSKNGPGCVLRM